MSRNHIGRVVHNYTIFVHTKENPSQAEWDEALVLLEGVSKSIRGSLVYTEGGSPNATQRKQLRDVYLQKSIPTAVLTDSVVARMAITALNLFLSDKVLPFAPSQIDGALDAIKAPRELWDDLKKALEELKSSLHPASSNK